MYYISADLCEKAAGRGSRKQPFPSGRVSGETGRRPPAAPGGGQAGFARFGDASHRRACGPNPAPCRNLPRKSSKPAAFIQSSFEMRPESGYNEERN